MSEIWNRLKSLKERYDPIVWLFGAVLIPVGGVLFYMYSAAISRIDTFQSSIETNIKKQLENQLKGFQDSNHTLFEQIKRKIVDELDSTYYFSKS
jgi:hypothetical protein